MQLSSRIINNAVKCLRKKFRRLHPTSLIKSRHLLTILHQKSRGFNCKSMEKQHRYPVGAEFYTLYERIGGGATATVHRAFCIPLIEIVAIKILDLETEKRDLSAISREAQTMSMVDHPNVLKSHCSFITDHSLWLVMPYMAGGSCYQLLNSAFPDGFGEEVVIATVLREVLKALEYLHDHLGHIHRDVKAGNILIDSQGGVKLGDFGVTACLFDAGDRQHSRSAFVGTPFWMAPEVIKNVTSNGYDYKVDIWSFGITALELAHGHAPLSNFTPVKALLMTLQNPPPSLNHHTDIKFSKSFKQMIACCLIKNPLHRPSAKMLLKHPFFKQARSSDYISCRLLKRQDYIPIGFLKSQSSTRENQKLIRSSSRKSGHIIEPIGRLVHAFM